MTISIVTCWLEHHELAPDYVDAVSDELEDDDEVIVIDNGDARRCRCSFGSSTWARTSASRRAVTRG